MASFSEMQSTANLSKLLYLNVLASFKNQAIIFRCLIMGARSEHTENFSLDEHILHHSCFEVTLRYGTLWQIAHIHVKVKKNPDNYIYITIYYIGCLRRKKSYFISVKKTTLFIAARGNKLTFYLILLPENLQRKLCYFSVSGN